MSSYLFVNSFLFPYSIFNEQNRTQSGLNRAQPGLNRAQPGLNRAKPGLNKGFAGCKALDDKATHFTNLLFKPAVWLVVGLDGLEPSTSRLSGARSNHLSYRPFHSRGFVRFHLPFFPVTGRRRVPTAILFPRAAMPLVEMMGIEPMTPCLQGRCSPS